MHEVIYMKAEFEPWWMFEEWEEKVVSRKTFVRKTEAEAYRHQLMEQLKRKYPQSEIREEAFAAFWREGEIEYCESCDDDMQMYHGILWLENGSPIKSF